MTWTDDDVILMSHWTTSPNSDWISANQGVRYRFLSLEYGSIMMICFWNEFILNYIFKLSEQDQQQPYERRVTVMPTMFLDDPNQNSLIDQADLEVSIFYASIKAILAIGCGFIKSHSSHLISWNHNRLSLFCFTLIHLRFQGTSWWR